MTSFHSDNWLFYDKRPTTVLSTLPLPEMVDSVIIDEKNSAQTTNMDTDVATATTPRDNEIARITVKTVPIPEIQVAVPVNITTDKSQLPAGNGQKATDRAGFDDMPLTATVLVTPVGNGDLLDECTARSLTSSSCHSERSVIHLNCVVCFEDDSSPNLATGRDILNALDSPARLTETTQTIQSIS